MKHPLCYSNGEFLSMENAAVPVTDLGVQRGYGIFDFLRVSRNIPLFLEDHLDRFFHSAAEMRLSVRESRQEMKDIILQLIRENNLQTSGIRLILTGGDSPDGYQIIKPGLVIIQQVIHAPADEMTVPGIQLNSYPFQRQLSHVKTTDYLMAIWLQPWLKNKGGDDILYHHAGMVSECPRSNFFIVTHKDRLVTSGRHMLKGITRKQVIALAIKAGIEVEERDLSLDEVNTAREAFITSSTKRIVPVSRLDNTAFPPLRPDSVTGFLWKKFHELELSLTSKG